VTTLLGGFLAPLKSPLFQGLLVTSDTALTRDLAMQRLAAQRLEDFQE
jgi:hypothetical protein